MDVGYVFFEIIGRGLLSSSEIKLGGGNSNILMLTLVGEDFHFGLYFSDGLKLPTRKLFQLSII